MVVAYRKLALCAGLGVLVLGGPVAAQEADDLRLETEDLFSDVPPPPPPPVIIADDEAPVLRRRNVVTDPYAPLGLRNGPLTWFPELETGFVVASNPARAASGGEADLALRIRPSLRLESDWSRHQLTASTSFDYQHFVRSEELASLTGNLNAALRLDVRNGTRLDVTAGYTLSSTGAANSEVPDLATDNRVDHALAASAAITHDAGFGEGTIRLGIDRQMFGDVSLSGGGTEANDDRDYTELQFSTRGTFYPGAVVRPFVEASFTPRVHDQARDRNNLKRNSFGYGITAGLRIADDPVWTGEVAATYLIRDYVDGSLDTAHAPGLLANIQWRPTELTSVDFNAGVALTETASLADSARTTWNFGANISHALRENITLFSNYGLGFDASESGTGVTATASSGLEWQMSPTIAWRAAYEGTWFNGPLDTDAYNDQRLIGSLILRR